MTTYIFTPPSVPENLRVSDEADDVANRLFDYYPPQETGLTVWKDALGVWHEQLNPHAGGEEHQSFYDGQLVSSTSGGPGLAEAQVVYYGGHNYEVSVTDALDLIAAGYGNNIVTFDHPVDQAFAQAEDNRWLQLIRDHALSNFQYQGGDITDRTVLPDTRIISIGADWLINGNIDGDDTYSGPALPARCNAILENSAHSFIAQLINSGIQWFTPDSGTYPDHHYWPIASIIEGAVLKVGCWLVTDSMNSIYGTKYGRILDSHVVTIELGFGSVQNVAPMNTNPDIFNVDGYLNDGSYTYIYGEQFKPPYISGYGDARPGDNNYTFKRVARVLTATGLSTPTAYEYWNGKAWTNDVNDSAPMVDDGGHAIRGDAGVLKLAANDFILAAHPLTSPWVYVYKSTTPYGPWRLRCTVSIPKMAKLPGEESALPIGQLTKVFNNYQGQPANTATVMISRNVLNLNTDFDDRSIQTYAPMFVQIPTNV